MKNKRLHKLLGLYHALRPCPHFNKDDDVLAGRKICRNTLEHSASICLTRRAFAD